MSTASSRVSPSRRPPATCFSITATADPSALPRILEVFAQRWLTPDRWYSVVVPGSGDDGPVLVVDMEVNGLSPDDISAILGRLRALVGVESVLVATKLLATPAAIESGI